MAAARAAITITTRGLGRMAASFHPRFRGDRPDTARDSASPTDIVDAATPRANGPVPGSIYSTAMPGAQRTTFLSLTARGPTDAGETRPSFRSNSRLVSQNRAAETTK